MELFGIVLMEVLQYVTVYVLQKNEHSIIPIL